MFNFIALAIFLILVIVFVIYKRGEVELFSFLNTDTRKDNIKEVLSKDIDRIILIELSKYERFLYSKGFTGRVNIEISEEQSDTIRVHYKFYYYNLIEGIHAFIMYNPYSKYRKFYFYFETKYSSGKSAISSVYEKYISSKIPNNIYYFKHSNNTTIEQLYAIHKRERLIKDETIHKERLHIDTLVKPERVDRVKSRKKPIKRAKKQDVVKERVKIFNDFKLPKIDLFKNNSNKNRATNTPKPLNKKIVKTKIEKKYILTIALIGVLIALGLLATKYLLNNKNSSYKSVKNSQIITTLNTKQELANLDKHIKLYSGLVSKSNSEIEGSVSKAIDKLSKFYELVGIDVEKLDREKKITIRSYLKELDSYIKGKKAPPLNKKLEKIGNCKYPKGLNTLLNWHNGVEQFVSNANLLSFKEIKESIKKGNKYIYLIANKELNAGIAFNCTKEGLYKYRNSDKNSWKKEFYNIKHLLSIVAKAYKERAFYNTKDGLKINLSRYYKIYRDSLSTEDRDRYKRLINYLKDRAKLYKERGSKELRVKVIKEMQKLYEPKLDDSIKAFRNDKNIEVRKLVIGD